MTDWLDEEEFDAAMSRFLTAQPSDVLAALAAIKEMIRLHCPEPDPPSDDRY